MLKSLAVVLEQPQHLALTTLAIDAPGAADVVVAVRWTGISTGTEKLLYDGRMPAFRGMGYPLVPGYEAVGEIVSAGSEAGLAAGAQVFVPGARCFGPVRGLHGGAASHLVSPAARVLPIDVGFGESGVLLALAATALHALKVADPAGATLIVGHGALGRLIARLALFRGLAPVVWETNSQRVGGARGYEVLAPAEDARRDYRAIIDASGDSQALDSLIQRLAPGGCVTLAGFYDAVRFAFPPAFMREASLRIAAQWAAGDLAEARDLAQSGALTLDGLVSHQRAARDAVEAYPTAFGDPACVKMVLDWSAT